MCHPAALPAFAPPAEWAEATFGAVDLGDARRTRRLVAIATAVATAPDATLPRQLGDPAALHATYRLLGSDAVTMEALLAAHIAQTRDAASGGVVLLVQDTTTLDCSAHPATTGLGPIGPGDGHGLHLQTVLAVQPAPRLPLGVLAAEVWTRPAVAPHPPARTERSAQRARRARESAVWGRLVTTIGPPPPDTTWVHVADRGADCFGFFTACHRQGADVLVRVVQNRCITDAEALPGHLIDTLRAHPAVASRPLHLPARHGQPARDTTVAVSWAAVTLQPPTNSPRDQPKPAPIPAWAVRVWEPDPPPAPAEPVEWLLVTTVPVETVADAWERRDWYTARWLIEDYHQCLKTGCRAETSQLHDGAPIRRRLGVVLPVAVRLLTLRELPRVWPDAPATLVAGPLAIRLLAARTRLPAASTVGAVLSQVARLGGHLGRRRDGPPGWRTLWRGWWQLETLLEGAHLAATLDDP
jgi:hypothetical protein